MKELILTKIFMTKDQADELKDLNIPYQAVAMEMLGVDIAQSRRTATEHKNNKLKKGKYNGKQ